MPRGGRKGSGCRRRGKGKSNHPPPEHKLWWRRIRPRSTLPRLPGNSGQRIQNPSRITCQTFSQTSFPMPPPCSPTLCPPSKANTLAANKPNRCSAKLTEAQQDTIFEWLEQSTTFVDTNTVKTNASKSLQLSYDHYKCLAIKKNGLRLLTNTLQEWEYAFIADFMSMFLNTPWTTANTYEHLGMSGDHLASIMNSWGTAFVSPHIRSDLRAALRPIYVFFSGYYSANVCIVQNLNLSLKIR